MGRMTRRVAMVEVSDRNGSVRAAEKILRDFEALLTILDGQGASAAAATAPDRAQLCKAKLAAARGLELSNHLVELLRTTH